MMLEAPRAVLFDWDNTLVDNWECIRLAMNATLRHMDQPEWTLAETKARVAKSLRDSFPAMFGERWTEARDVFYATFESIHMRHLTPLPGAEAMLAELAGQGIYLGVVSNKNGRFLRAEAQALDWTRYFGRLVGAADAGADKPSAEPVTMALDGSGITPGPSVWFVGDAPIDMHCAANSGCVPILLRGEAGGEEFALHPPRRHVGACGALAALVRQLSVPISGI